MINELHYGVDLFNPLYVPSKSIISLVDLIKFIRSDCHLKIAYIIYNLNIKMFCYCDTKGTGIDNSEYVQLFPIDAFILDPETYIKNVNCLFFQKAEISKCINGDGWLTFNRINSADIHEELKKTVYTLCHHTYNIDFNYKHKFSFYTRGDSVEYFHDIDANFMKINCETMGNLHVDYLDEYTSNLDGYVDMFNSMRNPPALPGDP